MTDARTLHEIQLYKIGNNEQSVTVQALDDYSFIILGGRGERKVFIDEDLKPDKNGKYIINIEYLDLKFFYPNVDLPKEFEMPEKVLEARKEKRRLNALAKDAIHISHDNGEPMYFYLENDKLRLKLGEKEVTSDTIKIKYNKKTVNVEGLGIEHTHLELPVNVAFKFESVLETKKLLNLKLVFAGTSALDGKKYYAVDLLLPPEKWDLVKGRFVFFEGNDELQGWLTCYPQVVAEILGIPIDGL